jgi:hypothetical protein
MSDPAVIRRSLKEQIIRDMQEASRQVDDANGTSDYNMRLVALALIARHFLRECADDLLADPVGGASPQPEPYGQEDPGCPAVGAEATRAPDSSGDQEFHSGRNEAPSPEHMLRIASAVSARLCGALDGLTNAQCRLYIGHAGDHWGHGPVRRWSTEAAEGAGLLPPVSEGKNIASGNTAVGGASPAPGWQVDREDLRAARDACWAQARDCENAARNMSDATMYQAAKQWNITAARLDAAMSAASSPSLEPPR